MPLQRLINKLNASPTVTELLDQRFIEEMRRRPSETGTGKRPMMLRLPEGERRILEMLVKHGNRSVQRQVLSDGTGYMRSSRDAYLSRLGARRLVEITGAGMVKAADTLFE